VITWQGIGFKEYLILNTCRGPLINKVKAVDIPDLYKSGKGFYM